jgi:catechol 2,3-dioxygenase-like lactoylglutathione lyase family enzyme
MHSVFMHLHTTRSCRAALWLLVTAACSNDNPPQPGDAATPAPHPDAAQAQSASDSSITMTQPPDTRAPAADAAPPPRDAGLAPPARDAAPPALSDAAASDDAGEVSKLPALCSGCPSDKIDPADMSVHLHHVHMNVLDRERSLKFYHDFFGDEAVRLNDTSDVLRATPVLLLFNQTTQAPPSGLPTALQHIGWGSMNVQAWFDDAHKRGVAPDTRGGTLFNTNETPTVGGSSALFSVALGADAPACFPIPDELSYMYVLGPDNERIEVWSGADKRVNHLHFTTPELAATMRWYKDFFGLGNPDNALFTSSFFVDDLVFFWEPIGEKNQYANTDDHVLAHMAFSVGDLAAWRERARTQKIEVVAEPAPTQGFMSFFVRGPDGVLIELVQAAPSPLLCPTH